MRIVYLLISVFVLFQSTGCAVQSAKSMNTISVGMSKQEVIKVLGRPDTSKAASGVEYLIYKLQDKAASCVGQTLFTFGFAAAGGGCAGSLYFVQLRNGAVSAYGKQGDFDSTKDPTLRILTQ